MSDEQRYVGIDVGSTTVKAVVLDGNEKILWKEYGRHSAKQAELLREFLVRIEAHFHSSDFQTFVTGSGGRALAPYLGAEYIQEVNAAAFAVECLYPDASSVIELGGQDAKVIIFKRDDQGRRSTLCSMNDKCAGGTGATLDKILGKIGMPMEEAAGVTLEGKTIHPVAAKCGVFAETDVVGLTKNGVDRQEILVSLCTAIVKQNLEVLVRGNVLRDNVLLLGGPHAFVPVFAEIWRRFIPRLWELHGWRPADRSIEELVCIPPNSEFYSAIGAVLYGAESSRLKAHRREETKKPYAGVGPLTAFIKSTRVEQISTNGVVREGLVENQEHLERFKKQYATKEFKPPELKAGQTVPAWIGVDGGSTSSKLAIIDDSGELLYKDYKLSTDNSISDIRQFFARLGEWVVSKEIHLDVRGAAVTGYAADILREAFSFDVHVVETVAHLRSALFYYGDVDIICDVGGQDIKVLFLGSGHVKNFRLNTQCSAGNGYFLQWIAEQFGVPIEEFAEHAFRAARAPAFNCGCAVFMEQDKVNFQQLGWTEDEIMAGLALVLPLNIWNCVVQESNIAKFGSRVLLQGGTQKNLAAVKAQVDFIEKKIPGAEVHVHKYADICGAVGAAIEAKDQMRDEPSRFVGIERAAAVQFRTKNDDSTRCRFCQNRCPRTFVDIAVTETKNVRFIAGNGCEQGTAESVEEMKDLKKRTDEVLSAHPNLADRAEKEVFDDFDFAPLPDDIRCRDAAALERRSRMIVGIPRLLNLFFYAPFFNTYLRCLGVGGVAYSGNTTHKLWEKGNKWGSIDPCFPAKVAPAHVYELLMQDEITHVLLPIVTHLPSHLASTLGNNACVIQMGTSEVVHAAFTKGRDLFAERGVEFLKPLIKLDRPREAEAQLYDFFTPMLDISERENRWAVSQGYNALENYLENLRNAGRDTINDLILNDRIGIVVLGHPYHHDPGLNHELLTEFQKRGYPILSIESIPVNDEFLGPLFIGNNGDSPRAIVDIWPRNFNRNTNHKIWAAKVVARHPNLAAIDLSSFKCGHDAPTYSYVEKMMNDSGTPHFLFHDIDQNKPHASLKIRVQTFDYFLKSEEEKLRAAARRRR